VKRTILYQKTRTGKIQQWSIWVEPADQTESGHPEVFTEYGQTDGKKQTTNDVIAEGVNVGKSNETTPFQQAILTMERKITKQKEKGYSDNIEDVKDKTANIDFSQPLSKELCFYKPKNSIDDKKIKVLEANNAAIYTVKRDGMMNIIRHSNDFGPEIYSRRMDLATDKYPHLVAEIKDLPKGTIILGEIILDKNGQDDFNGVSSICRSDPDKAIERQEELGKVSYYAFDLAYTDHQCLLTTTPYKERLAKLQSLLANKKYLMAPEVLNIPHSEALNNVKQRELEGLVVWDANGIMENDQAFTSNGKAYRPNVLWKSKPKHEDDLIVRFDPENGIGEYGKGKNNNKLKSVFCYQLDDDGNEVFLAKCGGGLSDEQREFYTNKATYPRVWRIEYDSIQAKTGSLRFPVFAGDRTLTGDKQTTECLMSDVIKHARKANEDE